MPQSPNEFFNDPEFRKLDPESQRSVLSAADPEFGRMGRSDQDSVLQAGVSSAQPGAAPLPFLAPHPVTGVNIPARVGELLRGGLAGAYGMATHPIDTLRSIPTAIGQSYGLALYGDKPLPFEPAGTEEARQQALAARNQFQAQVKANPEYTLGSILGPALLTHGAIKAAPVVAKGLVSTGRGMMGVPRTLAEISTGTGPTLTRGLVSKTIEANTAEEAATATQNIKVAQKATEDTAAAQEKYQKKLADVEQANQGKLAEHESAKAEVDAANQATQAQHEAEVAKAEELKTAAQEQQTQRGVLARQVLEQSARMVNRIRNVQAKVKANIDSMYQQVREKVGDASVPGEDLTALVSQAEKKIQGSSENIKIFRDIISKAPEGGAEPDYVVSGGTKFGPGTPVYESVKASPGGIPGAAETGKPATFADLQGYYSELGEKLSTGNLPGDVYQAMKFLHDAIGQKMQVLAGSKGAGAQLSAARNLWSDYMTTFREPTGPSKSGSPIAQSLLAQDPTYAVEPLTNPETAARIRNMLARFDPGVGGQGGGAVLYDNFLKTSRAYESMPKPEVIAKALSAEPPTAPKMKPMPEAPTLTRTPEAPKPVVPEVKQPDYTVLGPEDIRAAKEAQVARRAGQIRGTSPLATGATGLGLAYSLLGMNVPQMVKIIAARTIYGLGSHVTASILEHPGVTEWISDPTPKDLQQLMRLPPEQRTIAATQMGPTLAEAKSKGIRVSPALTAFVAAAGLQAGRQQARTGVAAALQNPNQQ